MELSVKALKTCSQVIKTAFGRHFTKLCLKNQAGVISIGSILSASLIIPSKNSEEICKAGLLQKNIGSSQADYANPDGH